MEHLLFHNCLVEFVRFIVVIGYLMTLCLVFWGVFYTYTANGTDGTVESSKNSPDERRWGNIGVGGI